MSTRGSHCPESAPAPSYEFAEVMDALDAALAQRTAFHKLQAERPWGWKFNSWEGELEQRSVNAKDAAAESALNAYIQARAASEVEP